MSTPTYYYGVGRRKSAIAQVRVYPNGSGKLTVNEKDAKTYFTTPATMESVLSPLKEAGKLEAVDVTIKAVGGGRVGQSDAAKMGIARALVLMDEANKVAMRTHGFLTRDSRIKERKKFGKRGARRSSQWRKR